MRLTLLQPIPTDIHNKDPLNGTETNPVALHGGKRQKLGIIKTTLNHEAHGPAYVTRSPSILTKKLLLVVIPPNVHYCLHLPGLCAQQTSTYPVLEDVSHSIIIFALQQRLLAGDQLCPSALSAGMHPCGSWWRSLEG